MKELTIEQYTRFNKVIFSSQISFLERLCSTMLFDSINELDKTQFVVNILEANNELEKSFSINEEMLKNQIQQMIEKNELLDLKNYYFISISPERQNEIMSCINVEERKAYFNLIKLYINKNQTNTKKKVLN